MTLVWVLATVVLMMMQVRGEKKDAVTAVVETVLGSMRAAKMVAR